MNCLRSFYIMAASLHAMISLASVGYYGCFTYYNNGPSDLKSTAILRVMNVYEFMIGFLAFIQLFAHLGILVPARVYPTVADMVTTLIGGGDLGVGINKFYKLIGTCNIAISIMLVWGSVMLGLVWSEDLVDINFYILVLMTLIILALVLMARMIAKCTGNVQKWFYLAWSVDPSTVVSA